MATETRTTPQVILVQGYRVGGALFRWQLNRKAYLLAPKYLIQFNMAAGLALQLMF